MLIAAVAAVAGAYADCQLDTPKEAAVYAWKFVGKTTVGALASYKVAGTVGNNCNLGGGTSTSACAIRVPGNLAIQGYLYYCENCCDAFQSGSAGATIPATQSFYMTKPFKDAFSQADITFGESHHIIGKSATQYEANGVATFTTLNPSVTYSSPVASPVPPSRPTTSAMLAQARTGSGSALRPTGGSAIRSRSLVRRPRPRLPMVTGLLATTLLRPPGTARAIWFRSRSGRA